MPEEEFSKLGNVAIYVYWSRNKTIEANTTSYVKELIKVNELVLFVSNSQLDSKDVLKLTDMGVVFLQRKNTGFDFWGWKEGISKLEDVIKYTGTYDILNPDVHIFEKLAKEKNLKLNVKETKGAAHIWIIKRYTDKKYNDDKAKNAYNDLVELINEEENYRDNE